MQKPAPMPIEPTS